jgi:uncharacterized protein involved in tolerance to divalent cations
VVSGGAPRRALAGAGQHAYVDAERIAKALVEARLAACVIVVPAEEPLLGGQVEATESTLLVKTQTALLSS